jgi:hypothetical protein
MDQLLRVVEVLTQHPHLRSLSLWQLVEFLTRVSSLKRSILLAGCATEPTDLPPEILPRLIQRFLAESIGIDMDALPDAWSLLKNYAWDMPTASVFVEKEHAAFHAHGWNKGLSESRVWLRFFTNSDSIPSWHHALSAERLLLERDLQREEQRTEDHGVPQGHHLHDRWGLPWTFNPPYLHL